LSSVQAIYRSSGLRPEGIYRGASGTRWQRCTAWHSWDVHLKQRRSPACPTN